MQIVNTVYRGKLKKPINLDKICKENSRHAKLYEKRPRLLKIAFNNDKTAIIFESGAYRVMGKYCDEFGAILMMYRILGEDAYTLIPKYNPTLQTITLTDKLPYEVNLYNLSSQIASTYDFELFPALKVTEFKPMCVNIFASGSIVITGCKDIKKAQEIFQ